MIASMRPSRAFLVALKLGPRPAWKVAREAGVSPTTLSRLVSGYSRTRPNDPRLLAVARVLGLSADQTFAREPEESTPPLDGDDSVA
jgi:transcriptional regulator with XRE-family HTH domain